MDICFIYIYKILILHMGKQALRGELLSPKSNFLPLSPLLELLHLSLPRDPTIFEGPWSRLVNTELSVSWAGLQLFLWTFARAQRTNHPFWTR